MMYDLVEKAGIKVEFGSEVTGIDVEAPAVSLADGRWINVDLIIGADGPLGVTRQNVVGHKEEPEIGPYATYSWVSTFCCDCWLIIPLQVHRKSGCYASRSEVGTSYRRWNGRHLRFPKLSVLLTFCQWSIWTGDTHNVLVYQIVRALYLLSSTHS